MLKTINVFNKESESNSPHFFSDLERELGYGSKCFNCTYCGDIISETGKIKDAIIECIGSQSGIDNIHINSSCSTHNFIDDYSILRKGD